MQLQLPWHKNSVRVFYTYLDGVKVAKGNAKCCREGSYVALAERWAWHILHAHSAPYFFPNFWIRHCEYVVVVEPLGPA